MGSALLTDRERVFTEHALEISGLEKPEVLTITTAKATAEGSAEYAAKCFNHFTDLGVSVEDLHDYHVSPSKEELLDKIGRAAVLFVAGGNTRFMINFWKDNGIADAIDDKVQNGNVVLSGGSAGALAWFAQGHSDSESYEVAKDEPWKYIFTEGLGYIQATACPHYDSKTASNELRRDSFASMLNDNPSLPQPSIGITNRAAFVINNEEYRTLQADSSGESFKIELDSSGNIREIPLISGSVRDL